MRAEAQMMQNVKDSLGGAARSRAQRAMQSPRPRAFLYDGEPHKRARGGRRPEQDGEGSCVHETKETHNKKTFQSRKERRYNAQTQRWYGTTVLDGRLVRSYGGVQSCTSGTHTFPKAHSHFGFDTSPSFSAAHRKVDSPLRNHGAFGQSKRPAM